MRFLAIFIFTLVVFTGFSQDLDLKKASTSKKKKGQAFVYWGWNRSFYSVSDIHFSGPNYEFTLEDVYAKDRQTPFALDPYFHPERITIPQTNLRVGFLFENGWSISLGDDHMKYVMTNGQTVNITGNIQYNSTFDGTYNQEPILLTEDFLLFEHTDGLNYVNIEARKHKTIWNNPKQSIEFVCQKGGGIGILYPKTNATVFGKNKKDAFHLAGYGTAIVGALQLNLFQYFFFQSELKQGFIHMPDILVSTQSNEKAKQHFFFTQWNFLFGFNIPITYTGK